MLLSFKSSIILFLANIFLLIITIGCSQKPDSIEELKKNKLNIEATVKNERQPNKIEPVTKEIIQDHEIIEDALSTAQEAQIIPGSANSLFLIKINNKSKYKPDKYGYINKTGKIVINPQFDRASIFSEELAAVKIDNKWGYIDKTGQYVINPQFDATWNFWKFEGLAAVEIDNKSGYIDKTGQYAINSQFDYFDGFSEGLAPVEIGGRYGYIDQTGQYAINPQFDRASIFSEGLAAVEIDDKWGYIDKTGRFIYP